MRRRPTRLAINLASSPSPKLCAFVVSDKIIITANRFVSNTFYFDIGAEGGTRTPTSYLTRPSNVRVCQFRHFGKAFRYYNQNRNYQKQQGLRSLV